MKGDTSGADDADTADTADSADTTRLRDKATSAYQRRLEQAAEFRDQLTERSQQFADELGLSADEVRAEQFGDRDSDVGFVPTDSGRDELATEFAADRPFVEPADVGVRADPQEGTRTRTAPGRRDDIRERAQQEVAGDTQFIEPGDLDVDVGRGGVTDVQTAADRRDDIRQRARQEVAADDPFANPGDFDVDVSASGVEEVDLTERGARRRAAREFEAETPLTDVGPDDLRETASGFGLEREPAREAAAAELSEQIDGSVSPSAVDLDPLDDGGFSAVFERGGGR